MKKNILAGWMIILLAVMVCVGAEKALALGPNLVPNANLETVSGTQPASWIQGKWGTNTTTFTYQTPGNNSSGHSVAINMTGYSSGDAKWYFAPISVTPSTDYTFSDYYISNVQTSIVAMSTDANGVPTYYDISTAVPASATWKQATYTFKTLANTKSLTIFHLIQKNGSLTIDDMSVATTDSTPVTPPPTPIVDWVPNNSVETASGAVPAHWTKESWGTNTPKYEYITNDGHDGSKSVKVTMTNYKDGDAKWVFAPQALPTGKDYRFTGWYKTNTIPHVVVQYIKADGSEDYFGMPDPVPSGSGWQKYSDVFSVPAGVQKVSVFFFLSNNGWVQTDDFHIKPFSYTPYQRAIVTLTFDDGFEDNVKTVLPILEQYKLKTTQCYATQYIEGIPQAVADVKTFASKGHEICSHSVTHPMFTTLTTAQMDQELSHAQTFLKSISGQAVTNFASPFGDYNAKVNTEIAKYYKSHRTTDEGFNSKDNFDPYRLRVQNMQVNTSFTQFQQWVNKAIADKAWLILLYHRVGTSDLEQFDTKSADFAAEMKWLASRGVAVERWDKALAEVSAQ
jgi:peptidoglycan/xylan/chitin deacetylase (PgdA/CDA1 family)